MRDERSRLEEVRGPRDSDARERDPTRKREDRGKQDQWKEGEGSGTGERVNGLPRPCEPPDHTGRAATTRPLQHPSSGSDSPSNRQTARLPGSYLTDRLPRSGPDSLPLDRLFLNLRTATPFLNPSKCIL